MSIARRIAALSARVSQDARAVESDEQRLDAAAVKLARTMAPEHAERMLAECDAPGSPGHRLWLEFWTRAHLEAGQTFLEAVDAANGRVEPWRGPETGRGPRRPCALPRSVAEVFLSENPPSELAHFAKWECPECWYGQRFHMPECPLCGAEMRAGPKVTA